MTVTDSRTTMAACVLLIVAAAACRAAPNRDAVPDSALAAQPLPQPEIPARPSPFDTAPPDMEAARRLAGCYSLTLGAWSNPRAHGGRIPAPPRVDLLLDSLTSGFAGFRLVAATPGFAARNDAFPLAWSPVGSDSLQARVWRSAMSSVTVFLRKHSDGELRGTARYFTDGRAVDSTGRWMWESYPTAKASLSRVDCAP